MHLFTKRYYERNEELKKQGLILDHNIKEKASNFSVDEKGLNYDLTLEVAIVPIQTPKFIDVNFKVTKSGFETE